MTRVDAQDFFVDTVVGKVQVKINSVCGGYRVSLIPKRYETTVMPEVGPIAAPDYVLNRLIKGMIREHTHLIVDEIQRLNYELMLKSGNNFAHYDIYLSVIERLNALVASIYDNSIKGGK